MPDGRLETLITAERIQARVKEMGKQIAADYAHERQLWLIAALKGAAVLQVDLARSIGRDVSLGYVRATSYGSGVTSSGIVTIVNELQDDIANTDVILVEDIVDTGRTARVLLDYLAERNPRTLRLASLLDKPSRRETPIEIDYRGFEIPEEFVVGYGLDYAESYRNLPKIAVLRL